jgi:hypothetical protein
MLKIFADKLQELALHRNWGSRIAGAAAKEFGFPSVPQAE